MSRTQRKLGTLISLAGGGTPSKENAMFWDGGIPWATVKDLKDEFLVKTQDYISELGLEKSASRIVPAGSIVIATRMAVGRAVMTGIDVAINQDLKAITCSDEIDEKYLLYYLLTQKNHLNMISSGATVKGIKIPQILDLQIRLPQIEEQKKIVAILDAADQLRQKDQQLIDHYTTLSQSLFLEMFGDPVANPKGWKVLSLDSLVQTERPITYGILKPGEACEDGVIMLRIQDIKGSKVSLNTVHKVSRALSEQYRRTVLKGDEILISLVGTIGLTARVPKSLALSNVHRNLGVICLDETTIFRDYFFYFSLLPSFKILVARLTKGGNQPLLNLGSLNTLDIPVPPIKLQDQFSRRIKLVEAQKKQAQSNLEKSDALFSSLLRRAFTGKLTSGKAA